MRKGTGFLVLFGIVGLLLSGPALAQDDVGAKAYKKHCKRCHGDDGKGVEKMLKPLKLTDRPDALSIVKASAVKMTDEEMTKLTREGKNKMKPYKEAKLSNDDLKTVIAHVRTLQKPAKGAEAKPAPKK